MLSIVNLAACSGYMYPLSWLVPASPHRGPWRRRPQAGRAGGRGGNRAYNRADE